MSNKDLIRGNTGADTGGGEPVIESAAEAKRVAARRWFLSRGAAGVGLVVVTMVHRRANADAGGIWNTKHVLSFEVGNPTNQAAADAYCLSLFGPGHSAEAHQLVPGQSLFNPNDDKVKVWYCTPPPATPK